MEKHKVSDDLQKVLSHLAGDVPDEKKSEVSALLKDHNISATYKRCMWYAGCYYCEDEDGNWDLIWCDV